MSRRRIWLDCDPGHDDAFAIVLALFNSSVDLIGISTTAGNQTLEKTTINAVRMLHLCRHQHIPVVKGANKPLLAPNRECPEIHGFTGLDLPSGHEEDAKKFASLVSELPNQTENGILTLRNTLLQERFPIDLVATGCLTNVALLLATFPEVN